MNNLIKLNDNFMAYNDNILYLPSNKQTVFTGAQYATDENGNAVALDQEGNYLGPNASIQLPEATVKARQNRIDMTPDLSTLSNVMGITSQVDKPFWTALSYSNDDGYLSLLGSYMADRNNSNWYVDRYGEDRANLVRQGLYNTILPFNYSNAFEGPYDKIKKTLDVYAYPENYQVFSRKTAYPLREAQYKKYLFGEDQPEIPQSQYRPSIETDSTTKYYTFLPQDLNNTNLNIFASDIVSDTNIEAQKNRVLQESIPDIKNIEQQRLNLLLAQRKSLDQNNKTLVENQPLGTFTSGIAQDTDGIYDYFYDLWDLNPFNQLKERYPILEKYIGKGDVSGGIGHPFEYYDRRYFNNNK